MPMRWFDADAIVDCSANALFAAEITLGGLAQKHRRPEPKIASTLREHAKLWGGHAGTATWDGFATGRKP